MIHKLQKFGCLLAMLTVLLSGCTQDVGDGVKRDVTLDLEVVVNNGAFSNPSGTRAPFTGDGTFEDPVTKGEALRMLRVIIIRYDDGDQDKPVVEHNRLVMMNPQTGTPLNDNLRFRIKSGEKKRIYLFGNEDYTKCEKIPNSNGFIYSSVYDFTSNFPEGERVSTAKLAELADIKISRNPGEAVIDNRYLANDDPWGYVPMSEFFDLDVKAPASDEDIYLKETFFITRSLIKCSFNFYTAADYPLEGASIAAVRIDGVADACWYLPKGVVYNPAKDDVNVSASSGREITDFQTPAGVTFSGFDYMLPPDRDTEIKQGLDLSYSPLVYLPESKTPADGNFTVSVLLKDAGNNWLTSKPLQIRELARNTHLKINIELRSTSIAPVVTLLPYTGVNLNPDFGI